VFYHRLKIEFAQFCVCVLFELVQTVLVGKELKANNA